MSIEDSPHYFVLDDTDLPPHPMTQEWIEKAKEDLRRRGKVLDEQTGEFVYHPELDERRKQK